MFIAMAAAAASTIRAKGASAPNAPSSSSSSTVGAAVGTALGAVVGAKVSVPSRTTGAPTPVTSKVFEGAAAFKPSLSCFAVGGLIEMAPVVVAVTLALTPITTFVAWIVEASMPSAEAIEARPSLEPSFVTSSAALAFSEVGTITAASTFVPS